LQQNRRVIVDVQTPLFWFWDLLWRFHILRGTNAPVRQSSRLRLVGRSTYLRSPGNAHLRCDIVSVQYSKFPSSSNL
jgi:hypothetical protein